MGQKGKSSRCICMGVYLHLRGTHKEGYPYNITYNSSYWWIGKKMMTLHSYNDVRVVIELKFLTIRWHVFYKIILLTEKSKKCE